MSFKQMLGGRASRPEDSRRIATINWWAFLLSLPVYALVVLLVSRGLGKAAAPPHLVAYAARGHLLLWGALAALQFVGSLFLPRWLERRTNKRLTRSPSERGAASEDYVRVALYQSALLLVIAMAAAGESIAVWGVVLGLLGAPPRVWVPFLAVSALHMVWQKTKHPSYFQRADERVLEIRAGYFVGES